MRISFCRLATRPAIRSNPRHVPSWRPRVFSHASCDRHATLKRGCQAPAAELRSYLISHEFIAITLRSGLRLSQLTRVAISRASEKGGEGERQFENARVCRIRNRETSGNRLSGATWSRGKSQSKYLTMQAASFLRRTDSVMRYRMTCRCAANYLPAFPRRYAPRWRLRN